MSYLTATELRALIQQTPAYRNAQAISNDEWAAQAAENPLFQAPMTVADLKFARDLQLAGVSQMGPDFTNYAAVQQWIAANRPSLTADDIAWLQQNCE
ncbi:hypothetical protein [Levilactobacillus brevis]|uniref:hypothetical protein n=1 Tax=Levilactobacillus brevis TaxID=1580 RepID=UPI002072DD2D|nr:hypothetical protein [Levilactobacillus brevis]MCM6797355.1 hypothetical protein [Levilactobacillus brevis]